MSHTITIDLGGAACFIHDDDLFDAMRRLGTSRIERASHVEPDGDGNWWADLSPRNGPVLGPYATRREALTAEREWLEVRL